MRGLWWLGVVAFLAGIGWLGWAWATGSLDSVPTLGIAEEIAEVVAEEKVWIPAVVAAAGAMLALAVLAIAPFVARALARRHRQMVESRLREATLTVAREVRDYTQARSALIEASNQRA